MKGLTTVHKTLWKYFDTGASTISLVWFKTVQTMKGGESFGERALLKHEARAATIYCSSDCIFATLSRIDYNKIIG